MEVAPHALGAKCKTGHPVTWIQRKSQPFCDANLHLRRSGRESVATTNVGLRGHP